MIKTIVFDFGDTLVDTCSFFSKKAVKVNVEIFKLFGIEANEKSMKDARTKVVYESHSYWKRGLFPGFFSKLICDKLGVKLNSKTAKKMDIMFAEKFIKKAKLKPFTKEALRCIKAYGYKIGLISTYDKYTTFKLIKKYKIEKYFNVVLTLDDIGVSKAETTPYKIILYKLKANPRETLMVGDNKYDDYYIPKQLGMQAILLRNRRSSSSIKNMREFIKYIKTNIS